VGDVCERIQSVTNSYIVPQDATEIAKKIRLLISSNNPKTNGLEVLREQGLDYLSVANQLENIYFNAMQSFK
jgi:hypothetical protein